MQEEFENIPQPDDYENEYEALLVLAFIALWALIISQLMRLANLPKASNQQMLLMEGEVTREVTRHFSGIRKEIEQRTEPMIRDAYASGIAYSKVSTGYLPKGYSEVTKDNFEEVMEAVKAEVLKELDEIEEIRIKNISNDTYTHLLEATQNTEVSIKQLIRSSFSEAMQASLRETDTSEIEKKVKESLNRKAMERKIEESQIAIIDKANRRWKLDTYINMATRTVVANTYRDAIVEHAGKNNYDLAVISSHPLTTDECNNYEGMIVSLNGKTPGYLTYSELKASKRIFHPNCRHFLRPFNNLKYLPASYKHKHEKQMEKHRRFIEKNGHL